MTKPKLARYRPLPSIRIGHMRVPIYFDPSIDTHHGFYQSVPRVRITITSQEPKTVMPTILHEVLHAIDDLHGLGLSEAKVRVLECALVELVRCNPKFVKLLQRRYR